MGHKSKKFKGKGTFGVVKERERHGTSVAEKDVKLEYVWKKEVEILREVEKDMHPNIIRMLDSSNKKKHKIFFELMDCDLYEILKREWNGHKGLGIYEQIYAYQIFRGIGYLGCLHPPIVHRDIKPENLLVKHSHGILKIADFGSAVKVIPNRQEYSYVCSRWYRAPELVCTGKNYSTTSTALDRWSAGVVMYELITKVPLFGTAKDTPPKEQLKLMLTILGSPTPSTIQELNPQGDLALFKWTGYPGTGFEGVWTSNAKDLLARLIVFSPSRRLSPYTACAHSYFDILRTPGKKLPNGNDFPDLFNFKEIEIIHMSNNTSTGMSNSFFGHM